MADDAAPRGATSQDYQGFILQRELAEVYLLLDYVSGSANRNLDDRDHQAPVFNGPDGKPRDWIQTVCEIAWPPEGSPEDQAEDIARLIRVRDFLNRAVAPANGLTIAFTLLVAGEGSAGAGTEGEPANEAGPGLASEGRKPLSDASGTPAPAVTAASAIARGWRGREPPSRAELADRAFPSLTKKADEIRGWLKWPPYMLIFWLIITCCLSWNVAEGTSLLAQLTTAETDQTQAEAQIYDALNGPSGSSGNGPGGLVTASGVTLDDYCATTTNLVVTGGAAANFNPITRLRLCQTRREKEAATSAAAFNLSNWAQDWRWLTFLAPQSSCSIFDGAGCRQAMSQQSTSSLLGVLSGSVLPIFYGLLGALAAVVRGLAAKVRDGQLAPRDRQISVIQLYLGAVIGACIGLFVTPAGAAGGAAAQAGSDIASAQGLLGPVHLGASALCFIAGFFVEGVFAALESLMRRVFNIADPTPRPQR